MKNWPVTPLSDLITLDLDKEAVNPTKEYEMVGVYSFGRGLFDREPVHGGSTSYRTFYRLHADHVVMSQLFGWEGALALSNDNFHGKYVSTQFPTFRVTPRIDRSFLGWWLRLEKVWDELKAKAKGMGDRRRTLNPHALLSASIPLPALPEQRRIVAKIESLAVKTKEAKRLRQAIQNDMNALLIAMAHRNDLSESQKKNQGWQRIALGNIIDLALDPIPVDVTNTYSNLGIYSFGRGLFRKAPIGGSSTSAKKLYKVKANQFIYSRLFAFEGAYAKVGKEYDGFFVSNEFPTFDFDRDRITSYFLEAYFQSPHIWTEIASGSKGLGDRRKRVHPEQILGHVCWLPPIEWQRKIELTSKKLKTARTDGILSNTELDALLPSILDKAFKGEL